METDTLDRETTRQPFQSTLDTQEEHQLQVQQQRLDPKAQVLEAWCLEKQLGNDQLLENGNLKYEKYKYIWFCFKYNGNKGEWEMKDNRKIGETGF